MKIPFLTLCLVVCSTSLFGQLCQKYRQQSENLYNQGKYTEALQKFQGAAQVGNAKECTDLPSWIAKCNAKINASSATKTKPESPKKKPETSKPTEESWNPSSYPTPSVAEPEMVEVAGGTYSMGSNDKEAYDFEKPVHSVTLTGFAIGKFEVTQAQWRWVMGSNWSELNFKDCDNCPVENVNWNDIQAFLKKLNEKTGKSYRLPTEEEWEFAARGGNKSNGYKYSGSNSIGQVAWYFDNSNSKTHPVGRKKPNELGLYDMTGNVWEWCSDWYKGYVGSVGVTDRTGSNRVRRGGSWNFYSVLCRATYRGDGAPTDRHFNLGFRVCYSLQ